MNERVVREPLTTQVVERMLQRAPRVTVVGDLILDGWWHGRSTRMSREAPVPVVDIAERRHDPGGAANTAVNLAALGARVRLVGIVGDDEGGARLLELLREAGVGVDDVLVSRDTSTVVKTRVIGSDQVLVRLDDTPRAAYTRADREELARRAVAAASGADAEVICDYSAGALVGPVAEALAARDTRAGITVVDAHDPRRWAALRPDLVTPNAGETERLVDLDLHADGVDRVRAVAEAYREILAATGSEEAVVTLDRAGTVLLTPAGAVHRTHAHPRGEAQASGAGDTFVAALAMARACGLSSSRAADIAQCAADIVVARPGTSVCSAGDLLERVELTRDPTIDADSLDAELARHRAAGRRIVFTNGCFDVLHRGHTGYLRQAGLLGDVLVVGLNGDDSVRRLKGPSRPVNTSADRAAVLAALACVDYVTVFETDTPIPLIERFRPDVYAKGGDYTPEMLEETAAVHAYGGEVSILDYLPSQSTTSIVERIRANGADAAAAGSS